MKSEDYNDIYNFLKNGEYPQRILSAKKPSHEQSNFRCKVKPFLIGKNNKLYKQAGESQNLLEIVQEGDVIEVIKHHHDYAAHPGINATIGKIRENHFWLGLSRDVKEYVKTCHICQINASLPPQPQKKLQPIIPPEKPWYHIGIDLICNLEQNLEGYNHILVTVCYLSKFCVARPLRTKTSREVLTQLENIYLSMGVPKIVQHDQGPEFTSKEFQEFHRVLKVDNRSTAAYHPQSNGLVEAHNKILKMKLMKMVMEAGGEWPSKLQAVVLAANTCSKRSTGYTPFYLMFGRDANETYLLKGQFEATFNNDNSTNSDDSNLQSNSSDISCLIKERVASQVEASQNILSEQLIQKSIYDKKVKKNRTEIKAGDQILYSNISKVKKFKETKCQPKFIGPVKASEVSDTHCKVQLDSNSKTKKIPLHITVPYHQRNDSITLNNNKKRKLDDSFDNISSKKTKINLKIEKYDKLIENWIFGIRRDNIIAELNKFKAVYTDFQKRGQYMSVLHQTLDSDSRKKGIYVPDTLIFKMLKDSNPENLRREILYTLMDWAEELFTGIGAMRCSDYVFKVLYGICMEYIENNLLVKHYDNTNDHHIQIPTTDPIITPLTVEWQKNKCSQLKIIFKDEINQHSSMAGQKLKSYQPWLCEEIIGDGNCLFRCLSKLISGSEEFHLKIRNELCRYMVTEGQVLMGWYFHQVHSTTPLQYLKTSDMLEETTWGSDIELMAASAMLATDIYVANKYTSDYNISTIRWSLIRCTNNTSKTNTIYISNYNSHYEPVTRMINSTCDTYYTYNNDNEIETIILDE